MNLTNLEIFSEAYRTGNFSAVARQRHVTPSSISRAIAALETELGVLLFYRSTRNISPTEAGIKLVERLDLHLDALRAIKADIAETRETASGLLRVSTSHSFGIERIGPILSDFRAAYPKITLDLSLSDRIVDIVGERFDLAIRHGPLPDSSLIAKPLLRTRYFACASPHFLRANGPIKTVKEISKHHCLTFSLPGFSNVWQFKNSKGKLTEVPIRGTLSANSGLVLRQSALRGDGIVLLSDWIIGRDIRDGRLIDLFPNLIASPTNFQTAISAVYPNRTHTPKKVSVFVSFLRDSLNRVNELVARPAER
jgi:DNA-binding transcriptional LysR family regulator